MTPEQNNKYVLVTSPAAILDNASATTNSIDTAGFDYLSVICSVGATDIAMTALKLGQSDTDSSYTDVTGLVYGTSTNINGVTSALPTAGDDHKLFVFEVDLRGKKRYFDLTATMGNGTVGGYFSAVAILSKGEISPILAAGKGADEVLRV